MTATLAIRKKMLKISTGKLAGIRCYALEASDVEADTETLFEKLESELLQFEPEPGMGVTIVGSDPIATSFLLAKLFNWELPFIAACNDSKDETQAVAIKSRRLEPGRPFEFQQL
ncbi:MAG: hypothetical protein F6J93_38920 [Oscillatoria sp. SIO1A7]|nr:hypothetical protein [Oscillatoria sp. SIO1A7]